MGIIIKSDVADLERQFEALKSRAFPIVLRRTLNDTAKEAMYIARKDVKRKMTLRNRYTQQSIQFHPIRSLATLKQGASTGSVEPYMAKQEFGGAKVKKSKVGVPIPTTTSSGESKSKRPRKRLPIDARKHGAMVTRRTKGRPGQPKNNRQAFVLKMIDAQKQGSGDQFFYHDFHNMNTKRKKRGIFMTSGGTATGRGVPRGMKKIRMVRDLTEKRVTNKPLKWLVPASRTALRKQPQFYAKALQYQLTRAARF